MLIISRYLGQSVLWATLTVLLALVGIEGFVHLLGELKDIGQGDYHAGQAMLYVLLSLPTDIYQLFPIAALLGALLGLGQLSDHSEIMVLRASGVSIAQLMRYLLPAVGLMLVLAMLLGEGIAPYAQSMAVRYKTAQLSQGQAVHTQRGVWVKDRDNMIHIRTIIAPKRLEGITRYELYTPRHAPTGAQQLHRVRFAPYALLQKGHWFFYHVAETVLHSDRHAVHVTSQQVPKQRWDVVLNARVLQLAKVRPVQQNLVQLGASIAYRQHAGLPDVRYAFVFWRRVLQPLMMLVMVGLGVVCALGCLRRVTVGLRLLVGLVLGLSFYLLNQFLGSFTAVYAVSPMLLAVLPAVMFSVLAVFLAKEHR